MLNNQLTKFENSVIENSILPSGRQGKLIIVN
jgi:hypothetical protein